MVGKFKLIPFLKRRKIEIVSLCVAVVVWQFIADFVVKNPLLLPSFSDVLMSLTHIIPPADEPLWKTMIMDSAVSLLHLGIGLGAAICIGILAGAAMGWFKTIDRALDPLIEIIRPIPPIAWIPFAILWFGLTHFAAGFIIFMGAVFPILINTYAGFKSAERTLVEAAKVLGCTRDRDVVKSVVFPSALPSIATGIRVGMGIGWMCVVAAEMFGVMTVGLGYRLWAQFYYLHQMDHVLLYMVAIGLIMLFMDRVFRYFVEKKLLRWRRGIVV